MNYLDVSKLGDDPTELRECAKQMNARAEELERAKLGDDYVRPKLQSFVTEKFEPSDLSFEGVYIRDMTRQELYIVLNYTSKTNELLGRHHL